MSPSRRVRRQENDRKETVGGLTSLIGVVELAGAIGLLIPKTTRWAAVGLVAVMLGAAYTHVSNGEGVQVLRPLIFMGGLAAILLLKRGSD
ncbi:MAG: DoxX family protein [Thermoanaerobaculia bacterium]